MFHRPVLFSCDILRRNIIPMFPSLLPRAGRSAPARLKERRFGRKIIEDLPPKGAGEENMNAVLHLVNYAVNAGLIADCERTWALNTLLDVLKADALPDLSLECGPRGDSGHSL